MILFLIITIGMAVTWIYRTVKGYFNTDYIADYEVKV